MEIFIPGGNFNLLYGVERNLKKIQLYENIQSVLKIFQPELKYNSLKKKENLEG